MEQCVAPDRARSIPLQTMTWFLESARLELDPFEDGTPLDEATKWPEQALAGR